MAQINVKIFSDKNLLNASKSIVIQWFNPNQTVEIHSDLSLFYIGMLQSQALTLILNFKIVRYSFNQKHPVSA